MRTSKRSPQWVGRIPAGKSYSREVLARVAQILVHTGHSPTSLEMEFRAICSVMQEPVRRWNPEHLEYFADIPHVIAHWHSNPQYLDSRGKPIPLPLRGRGPSLKQLIERVLPGEDPLAVAESLTRVKALQKRGKLFIPGDRHFTYPRDIARIQGLTTLLGMLRTVEHNLAGREGSSTILERAAFNPSFPVSALPAFRRRLKALATEFLWNADSDMRRRENVSRRGPRIRLGVGVYTFETPGNRKAGAPKLWRRGAVARRAQGAR
jgi:Family of unknown function (DUF6502)